MSDTGFKVSGAVVSAGTWTNFTTTRLNTSDNSYTTITGTTFAVGTVNNFAFGIPAGATIDGIEVNVEFRDDTPAVVATVQISLSWNNGANYTAVKSDTVTGITDTVRTYGGAADVWGHAFTDSEMADGTFLMKVEGKSGTAPTICGIDYLEIKVYYTTAAGSFVATIIII